MYDTVPSAVPGVDLGPRSLNLSQSEIENLHLSSRRDEYIRRFNIAVHDALRVCRFQSVSNLDCED